MYNETRKTPGVLTAIIEALFELGCVSFVLQFLAETGQVETY